MKIYYAVFRAFSFEKSLLIGPMQAPAKTRDGDPSHFIPLFSSKEDAIEFNDGKTDGIKTMETEE